MPVEAYMHVSPGEGARGDFALLFQFCTGIIGSQTLFVLGIAVCV